MCERFALNVVLILTLWLLFTAVVFGAIVALIYRDRRLGLSYFPSA